ncbi:pentatricopeptide repeat-containing protein [Tripterygium wilfordii]|uniref:Pentatricopeptide repeat-containing protein n=1 Tax=Tripterygium wilfordii TaxID=458696 RepID=A0A7J7CY46_TRIWF|nr:pentatricopeptide repeat-containing protein At1g80880, mitochondrial [Tripterygium wilfordii]KAF5739022.1 pentatricopeptide repeat-containing protein [Tripterygium wilfordii]
MALFCFTRRLQKSQFIFPFLHRFSHAPTSLRPLYSLSSAFHQTRRIPFETRPHFSALQWFSTRTFVDPFEITERIKIQACDPRAQDLLQLLKQVADFPSEAEAMVSLNESGIEANQDLIYSVIWVLREEWRIAFLAFKWGEKLSCVDDKACELMVWVLGNHGKFNVAWCLIRDLHRASLGGTRRAMLIMIDRYAAANDPGKAIRTFHIMEKFRLSPDEEAFHRLLKSLCKNGNTEEAEEFMLINKNLFPLDTEGFNIVLNGWCNISVDIVEAKRVWREMSKCCISPNATSYTYMISCFSKVGNLFDSLRLYNEMKRRGWTPGFEIYNALIYVLTRENCLKEALKILDKMKEEGLQPNSATYNSMICPLCKAKREEEARNILATMIGEQLTPTIETYHAFLEGADFEGTSKVLDLMRAAGLGPNGETFFLILGKFLESEQPDNALKLWLVMKRYEVIPDLTHYTLLVEGLAKCGLLIKAREFYSEMKSIGIPDDPKLKKILKEPARGSRDNSKRQVRKFKKDKQVNHRRANEEQSHQRQSRKKRDIN